MPSAVGTRGHGPEISGFDVPGLIEKPSKGYFIVDKDSGRVLERLSTSGKRVLRSDYSPIELTARAGEGVELTGRQRLTDEEMLRGINEGRYIIRTQEEILAEIPRSMRGAGMTGGGDCAGIADFLASFQQRLHELNPELAMLGVRNAGKGLSVPPEQFEDQLIFVEGLAASDFEGQSSTPYGSARVDPLKKGLRENTVANIGGYGFFYGTGGNDHLKVLENIALEFPDMVVVGTFKSIDNDGCILISPFSLAGKPDIGDITEGFSMLGLKTNGDFTAEGISMEAGESGSRWNMVTSRGQRWILQHDREKGELRIYEEADASGLPMDLRDAYAAEGGVPPILRRTLAAREEEGKLVTVTDMPCQMLGADTAVRVYQEAIWAAATNADTHDQWHVIETFGRGAGILPYRAAMRYPQNFHELLPEEQRKIEEYRRAVMILVPEKPATLRAVADEARAINEREGNVVVVVAEGFMPPELKHEMDRLAKDDTLRQRWLSRDLKVEDIPMLIEVADEDDPRADLKIILGNRELAAQFGKTVWESELDDHGNVTKLAGISNFITQALHKLSGAAKVNQVLENYEARGATPSERDRVMGQKVGWRMAELVHEGVTGGKAVVYSEGMDPLTQEPVVVDLVGVSDKNTLKNTHLYPQEELQKNGVLIVREDEVLRRYGLAA
ncbi:MAG: 6-phosphofructokinase [Candidatus Altiarchaeota archaeon]